MHETFIDIVRSLPDEVDAGQTTSIVLRVTCRAGCKMEDAPVRLVDGDSGEAVETRREPNPESGAVTLVVTVPVTLGDVVWNASCARHDRDGVVHEESPPVEIRFRTVAHKTSMAVWDVQSPVAAGCSLEATVGVRCSAACALTGQLVQVLDDEEAINGEARLGPTPLEGTDALYWTTVGLTAPATSGLTTRLVRLADTLGVPHEPVRASFTFMTTPPSECRVVLTVMAAESGSHVPDTEVRVGLFRAVTDGQGAARVDVPRGSYEVTIRRDGYDAVPFSLDVTSDMAVTIEAKRVPTMAERAETLTSFEGFPWG